MSYSRVTRHENRNFRFGFQQPHAILEFLFVKPEEPHLSILGSGISVQNCSCWQKITSKPGFATRAADTSDTAASLAPFLPCPFSKLFGLCLAKTMHVHRTNDLEALCLAKTLHNDIVLDTGC
jgi:hypothetical protein